MAITAFKNGVDVINEEKMNVMLNLQPFVIIYEGTLRDSKLGSGVLENNLSLYHYCARFTLNGSTEIARIELHLDNDGVGNDLVVQIRSGMNPASGIDGTTLKEVRIPKEFLSLTAAYLSIPIDLLGLTSGGQYWIVVTKGGDAANKIDWVGETSPDASYPTYKRAGDNGVWTSDNILHFKVFSGDTGLPLHIIEGINALTSLEYSDGLVSKITQYIPPVDTPLGGIRDILVISNVGGLPKRGS